MPRDPWVATSAFCNSPRHHPLQNAIGAGWDGVRGFPHQMFSCLLLSKSETHWLDLPPGEHSPPHGCQHLLLFLNKIQVLHVQSPGKARYFQAPWEGFSTCSSQSPDPTQGKGGTDYVIALGLLNLCHSAIKEWGFLNLIEITRSQCEHLAVMISVNYRLPNPCTAPWAISHCFHVLCLQKYARGFSFVSFFFF